MINFKDLPKTVKLFIHHHDGWIIGSAANPRTLTARDIDIVIPFKEWNKACILVPNDAKKNNYGGWKYKDDLKEIDVWPDDLNNVMKSHMVEYLWQPKYNLRYKREQ